jgi:hypothetical protein
VDGYCCGSASCTDCSSCNVSGHQGTCYPVAAGTADGTCVASCPQGGNQVSGLCDGSGSCRGASSCPNGQMCGSSNQCATDCSSSGCVSGDYCLGGSCVQQKANGVACTGVAGECSSGNCVDGYCCATSNCGVCQSCNVSGLEGTCQNSPVGTPCGIGYTCDGSGDCQTSH